MKLLRRKSRSTATANSYTTMDDKDENISVVQALSRDNANIVAPPTLSVQKTASSVRAAQVPTKSGSAETNSTATTHPSSEEMELQQPISVSEQATSTKASNEQDKAETVDFEPDLEVNYDMNPTLLYKFIEYKEWDEAIERCKQAPIEASTWVVRYEEDEDDEEDDTASVNTNDTKKLRWKMLPVHAAIIFKAPLKLITSLHEASPKSMSCGDDRKMLPLHLACRIVSDVNIAKMLIGYDSSMLGKTDYKGRTPVKLLLEYRDKNAKDENYQNDEEMTNRANLINFIRKEFPDCFAVKLFDNKKNDLKERTSSSKDGDEVIPNVSSKKSKEVGSSEIKTQESKTKDENDNKTKTVRKQETEIDYDTFPTKLIRLVEKQRWEDAIQRCEECPDEASTWMCRLQEVNDDDNVKKEVRWRILPIHSAIVLHAPVQVIEALVDAYPDGIKMGDDRQMLPLHMAFRLGSSPETSAALVDAYPEALAQKDIKGHTPLHILKAYRRKYEREKKAGKKVKSATDKNRKALIQFYLGSRRRRRNNRRSKKYDRSVSAGMSAYDSDTDDDSFSSYDSSFDDFDNLFHKDMFSEFGRLTIEGLATLPVVIRRSMRCV